MTGVRREKLKFVSWEAESERIMKEVKIKQEKEIDDNNTITTKSAGVSVKKFKAGRGQPLMWGGQGEHVFGEGRERAGGHESGSDGDGETAGVQKGGQQEPQQEQANAGNRYSAASGGLQHSGTGMRQSKSGDLSPTGSTLTGEKQNKPGDLLAGLKPPQLTQGARVDGSKKGAA
jgi:hypothetical protein